MKIKQIISCFLLSATIYTSTLTQEEPVPPLRDVAKQVKEEREKEQTKSLLSTDNYLENQLRKPYIAEREPVEYFCRNLLVVFGIGADSYLSDVAVRQLRRRIIREAESNSHYFNEIGLKLDKPKQIDSQGNKEVREISKIEYNLVSGLGISFKPYNEVFFETKLAGSADPLRLKATPKIKAELNISDYLEFYGEIQRTFEFKEVQPIEYEFGFNLNVLNLWKKYHPQKERKPLEEVLKEFRKKVEAASEK